MYQGAAALTLQPAMGSLAKISGGSGGIGGAQGFAQLAVNQNALSKVGGDQIAEGMRGHFGHLLETERKVAPRGLSSDSGDLAVRTIGGSDASGDVKAIGEPKQGGDDAMRSLKDAFEYATNAALVSLVVTGVTNGITTLTSKGG